MLNSISLLELVKNKYFWPKKGFNLSSRRVIGEPCSLKTFFLNFFCPNFAGSGLFSHRNRVKIHGISTENLSFSAMYNLCGFQPGYRHGIFLRTKSLFTEFMLLITSIMHIQLKKRYKNRIKKLGSIWPQAYHALVGSNWPHSKCMFRSGTLWKPHKKVGVNLTPSFSCISGVKLTPAF